MSIGGPIVSAPSRVDNGARKISVSGGGGVEVRACAKSVSAASTTCRMARIVSHAQRSLCVFCDLCAQRRQSPLEKTPLRLGAVTRKRAAEIVGGARRIAGLPRQLAHRRV